MYDPYANQFNPTYNMYRPTPQMPSTQLIRVTGIDGARAYQMGANSSVALFDANEDIFYVKTTDGACFPTIRAFRFEPYDSTPMQPDYVTRAEFEELKGAILNGKQFVSEQPRKQTSKSNERNSAD